MRTQRCPGGLRVTSAAVTALVASTLTGRAGAGIATRVAPDRVTVVEEEAKRAISLERDHAGDSLPSRTLGVARSDAEAERWFKPAAAQGHERARKALR